MYFEDIYSDDSDIPSLIKISTQLMKDKMVSQAVRYFHSIFNGLKKNPFYLCSINNSYELAQILAYLFNSKQFSNNADLQHLIEMSYFSISKTMTDFQHKGTFLNDRLIILYNGNDYMIKLIGNVLNIPLGFDDYIQRNVAYKIKPRLESMKISDLFDETKILQHDFLVEQKEEFEELYNDQEIQNKRLEGIKLHSEVFGYLFNLYSKNVNDH